MNMKKLGSWRLVQFCTNLIELLYSINDMFIEIQD